MISKQDVVNMSDEQILNMIESAKGCTETEKFREKFDCDFSYAFLRNELISRGYVLKYVKESDQAVVAPEKTVVKLKAPEKQGRVRKTVEVSKDTWDKWKKLTDALPWAGSVLDAALQRFIDDEKNGKIMFEIGR